MAKSESGRRPRQSRESKLLQLEVHTQTGITTGTRAQAVAVERANQVMKAVGLPHTKAKKVTTMYSGGWKGIAYIDFVYDKSYDRLQRKVEKATEGKRYSARVIKAQDVEPH